MKEKEIVFSEKARESLISGVDKLADAVKITMGCSGKNVIIDIGGDRQHITKDGVTVAKSIKLKDKIENMGAQMVIDVASKTNDDAGDGTTTATVLAQSIVKEGVKHLTSGANPVEIKAGIDMAVREVVSQIKKMSTPISESDSSIRSVATISANGDKSIGELIEKAVHKVGGDGVITVEEASGMDTYVDVVDGMKLGRGYVSPYFVTDQRRMAAVLENPYILLTDETLSSVKDFIKAIKPAMDEKRSLLVVAKDIEGEALAVLVLNNQHGTLKNAAIKAPGFGDNILDNLEDIAIVTGATVISKSKGLRIDEAGVESLGTCEKVSIEKNSTTLVGGNSDKQIVADRISHLKELQQAANSSEKKMLQARISRLSGGVAVIRVGAASEVEMREKKDRVDDALAATLAAIEEGVVPGGGYTYVKTIPALENLRKMFDGDVRNGITTVMRALEVPMKVICNNAGANGEYIVGKCSEGELGYNARTGEYVDLFKDGVIDPTKVTRVALENAASVASLLLTTDCAIIEED